MPVKIGGRWRTVGKVMMDAGDMFPAGFFSALKTEAAVSSGTGVSVCFLCRRNWTFKYY